MSDLTYDLTPVQPPTVHDGMRVLVDGEEYIVVNHRPVTCSEAHPGMDVYHSDGHPELGGSFSLQTPEPATAAGKTPTAGSG